MIEQSNPKETKSQLQPIKSVEGWIIIVTNLHQDSLEDDIFDAFSKFGQIKSLQLDTDRKTCKAKGHALLQYEKYQQAEAAINNMNGEQIYEQKVKVDWVFMSKPLKEKRQKRKEK